MDEHAFGELVSSRARLRIAHLVSLRPRGLRELSSLTLISVQAVLKHLAKLEELGVVKEMKVEGGGAVRKVYAPGRIIVQDFSQPGMMVVKADERPGRVRSRLHAADALEALSEDALMQRRRVRDSSRRLARLIGDLFETEAALMNGIESLGLSPMETLVLATYFTEDSAEEAERVMARDLGLRDPARALDAALAKAKRHA
jgi:predicted transcriptional regulator